MAYALTAAATSAAFRAPARPNRGQRRRSAARCWTKGSTIRSGATLDGLDQDAPVTEAADAHASDKTVVRWITDVVVEDQPIVEQYAQRMAADLDRDRRWLGIERRVHVVERTLAVRIEMGDGARPDIADQRRAGRARGPAADEARRLDAEIFGNDRDLIGPQTAVAVQQVGDCGGRAAKRFCQAAAGFAGPFEGNADPVDGQS